MVADAVVRTEPLEYFLQNIGATEGEREADSMMIVRMKLQHLQTPKVGLFRSYGVAGTCQHRGNIVEQ